MATHAAPAPPASPAPPRRSLQATVGFAVVSSLTTLAVVCAWAGAEVLTLVAGAGAVLMGLAPLLARLHLGRLVLSAPSQDRALAGVDHPLQLEIENRGLLAARDLLVTIHDGRRAPPPPTGHLACLAPGRSSPVRCVPRFGERGRLERLRVSVESSFPLGLFTCRAEFELPTDLLVLPRLGRLGPLEQRLHRRGGALEDAPRGSPGNGEFYALRDWREGESLRGVAWKVSAHRGRILCRELVTEDRPALSLVLSTWVTAAPPPRRGPPPALLRARGLPDGHDRGALPASWAAGDPDPGRSPPGALPHRPGTGGAPGPPGRPGRGPAPGGTGGGGGGRAPRRPGGPGP